jgi:hypothetical protein
MMLVSRSSVSQIYKTHNCITYMVDNLTDEYFEVCFQIIDLLISYGANIHHSSQYGNALTISLNKGYRYASDNNHKAHVKLFDKLMTYNLKVETSYIDMDHLYYIWFSDAMLEILIRFGKHVVITNRFLKNYAGCQEILDYLVMMNRRITAKMVFYEPVLMRDMISGGNYEHVKYLFDDGLDQSHCNGSWKCLNILNLEKIDCRTLLLILNKWNKVSDIGAKNLLHRAVSSSRKDIVDLLISYSVNPQGIIYTAMLKDMDMFQFVAQYEQPDPKDHRFTDAMTSLVMKVDPTLFLYVIKEYKLTQATIDELYKHLMFEYNCTNQSIINALTYYCPTSQLFREEHVRDGLYDDISEGADMLLKKCKSLGYLFSEVDHSDKMKNRSFRIACANGDMKLVKTILNRHRKPIRM